MGTMTFGGRGNFADVGSTRPDEARRQVDQCLAAGVNLFDTADVYSGGLSEELVATKVRMPMGSGPNDAGLSRHHIVTGCEASLRRLGTDHIDLYQVHERDGLTPLEETLEALDLLGSIRQGPLRGGVQLRRLAAAEGARHRRQAPLAAVRQPADLLLAAGPRR